MTPQSNPTRAAAGCIGKARFDSRTLANRINEARSRGRVDERREPYRCADCHGWHLGNKTQAKRRNPRQR